MGPKKMKTATPEQRKGSALMKQMGLFQEDYPGGDDDLEAELLAITGGGGSHQRGAPKKSGRVPLSMDAIEKLALQSDVGLDDDDDEADFSGNEEDLMAELHELQGSGGEEDGEDGDQQELVPNAAELQKQRKATAAAAEASGVSILALLEERASMYSLAVQQCSDDDSKRRRLERGLKTLNDLLKNAKSGKPIDESSVPPPVTTKPRAPTDSIVKQEQHSSASAVPAAAAAAAAVPSALVQPATNAAATAKLASVSAASEKDVLIARRDEYKRAALLAKGAGSMDVAKQHLVTAKKLDAMIAAVEAGTPVDMSSVPVSPSLPSPSQQPASGPSDRLAVPGVQNRAPSPGQSAPAAATSRLSPTLAPSMVPPGRQSPAAAPTSATSPAAATLPKRSEPIDPVLDRQRQYKAAALQAKKNGDMEKAKQYLTTAKKLDSVIAAVNEGKPMEEVLELLPPPLPGFGSTGDAAPIGVAQAKKEPISPARDPNAQSSVAGGSGGASSGTDEATFLTTVGDPTKEEAAKLFGAPAAAPTSLLDALQQCQEKYRTAEQEATTEGNSSKARRMNRIVKQYDDAVKACRAGKPFEFSELPVPPGFPPLPLKQAAGAATAGGIASATAGSPATAGQAAQQQQQRVAMTVQQSAAPAASIAGGGAASTAVASSPKAVSTGVTSADAEATKAADRLAVAAGASAASAGTSPQPLKRQTSLSINEKQYQQLVQRQQEYRAAAVEAKRGGDLELAKNYLRLSKGLEAMISASRNGLPVNMQSVPPPPPSTYNPQFVVDDAPAPAADDASSEPQTPADREEEFKKLTEALKQQITSCSTNAAHYRQLGDIASATKFEAFEQNHKKDLEALKNAFRHGDPVPKYHFETKTFPMIQCNMELGDNDLEVAVIQGTQYGSPEGYQEKDVHTYVSFVFPYPQEESPKFNTHTCKGSSYPAYKETFKIAIDRKSHKFLRIVRNKSLKFEVYYKRGFLKEDRVLGSASVKLETLEEKCVVHECLDLMDGRKAVGGKLEIKLRLRKPLLHEQVEVVTEKWLAIDQFVRKALPPAEKHGNAGKSAESITAYSAKPQSVEVLAYEKRLLDEQIRQLQGKLSGDHLDRLRQKSRDLTVAMDRILSALRDGTLTRESYIDGIRGLSASYLSDARAAEQAGEQDKLRTLLEKARIVKHEIDKIAAKSVRK